MSHTVTVKTEIKSKSALDLTCQRLNLEAPKYSNEHRLFGDQRYAGYAVNLRNWAYPIICDLDRGETYYDNYNGHWGAQEELNTFMQTYAVTRTLQEASLQGYTAYEEKLEDGTIKVTVNVGG